MDRLAALLRTIEARAAADRDALFVDRLRVTRLGDLAHLDFYGDPFGESFDDLLATLCDPAVARVTASLELRGPDEGANGTRNWDLTRLADGPADFPRLRRLAVEQTRPADHNRTVVAQVYEEGGVLARILAKSPALEVLVTPSAPDAGFFRTGPRPIKHLSVDAGYDHQGFIANLARSTCFPALEVFEFGEFHETYLDDWSTRVTPVADYRELFTSPAFAPVRLFRWRNPACTPSEVVEIRRLKTSCQVQVVRWSAEYVR